MVVLLAGVLATTVQKDCASGLCNAGRTLPIVQTA
jgi:hypothetical protein